MKKITLLILLSLSIFGAKAQTSYIIDRDTIRIGKTAGTGGTSLYGKVYLKNVSAGLSSDSILTVRNGRIFKIPVLYTTSVSGTTNRITSSGGTTPVIDISTSYAGQISINTLGTITTGVWNAQNILPTYGGTGLTAIGTAGQVLRTNAGASGLEYRTLVPTDILGLQDSLTIKLNKTGGTMTGTLLGTSGIFSDNLTLRQASTVDRFKLFVGNGTTGIADDNYIRNLNTDLHVMGGISGATEIVRFANNGTITLYGALTGTSATFSGNISASNLTSGTYTPTLTNLGLVTSSTAYVTQYTRVGNIVTMHGSVSLTFSGVMGGTMVELTLPIASNFTDIRNVTGTGSTSVSSAITNQYSSANITNDKVYLNGNTSGAGSAEYYFSLSYTVL